MSPTTIIVKIKGKEKFYRGTLLSFARKGGLPHDFFEGERERNHRPKRWKGHDAKTVLFIHGLERLKKKPFEVANLPEPQHPNYF